LNQKRDNQSASEIDSIRNSLKDTNDAVQRLSNRFSEHFEEQFRNLATIGVTTIITAISIVGAFAAFLGTAIIKEQVKTAHEAELKNAREFLAYQERAINASIFSMIAANAFHLYKYIRDPAGAHREIYLRSLNSAINFAEAAYEHSRNLDDLSDNIKAASYNILKKDADYYVSLARHGVNNYLFYLIQRGNAKDKILIENTLLPKLVKISTETEVDKTYEWWCFKETVAWTRLHLGREDAISTAAVVQSLLNNPDIDPEWKSGVRAQYELYNKLHPSAQVTLM
jgi:hypothetical protein